MFTGTTNTTTATTTTMPPPPGEPPSLKSTVAAAAAAPRNHRPAKPCRYGSRCYRKNRGCKFLHPDAEGAEAPPTSVSPTNTTVSSTSTASTSTSTSSYDVNATATTTTSTIAGTVDHPTPSVGAPIVEMVDFMAIEAEMLRKAKAEAGAVAEFAAAAAAPKAVVTESAAQPSPSSTQQQQSQQRMNSGMNNSATNLAMDEKKSHRPKRQKQPPQSVSAESSTASAEASARAGGAAESAVTEVDDDAVTQLADTIMWVLQDASPVVAKRALELAQQRLQQLRVSGAKYEQKETVTATAASSSLGSVDDEWETAARRDRAIVVDKPLASASRKPAKDHKPSKVNGDFKKVEAIVPPATPPSKPAKIAVPESPSSPPPSLPSALRNSPRSTSTVISTAPVTAAAAAASSTSPVPAPRRRASSVSFAPDVKDPAASEPTTTTSTSTTPVSSTDAGTEKTVLDAKVDEAVTTAADTSAAEEAAAEVVPEESEADKKKRRLEEMRRQQAVAAEKKMQKKKNRHDKYLQELEESAQKRKEFWATFIDREESAVDKIVALCETEFCRFHGYPFGYKELRTRVTPGSRTNELRSLCQEAYRALLGDDIPTKVTVQDPKLPDWNGRAGTIECWDQVKRKFYVALETRKGKNVSFQYLDPESLEASGLSNNRKAKAKSLPDSAVFRVYVREYYDYKFLMLNLEKHHVTGLLQASSMDYFLASFVKLQNRRDAEAKRMAEEAMREEEERRRRRAERHRREQEEWERRQREYAAQKARMREMRNQYRRGNSCGPYCNCQRCQFERQFAGFFFHAPGGRAFHFGGPEAAYYDFFEYYDGSDSESGDEDEWDRRFNRMHEDDLRKKNEEAASTLGVEVDASATEIKRAYRTKARMYHPDSYRPEYHDDGTTKEEAEEHFKKVSDAYDLLMSNLED